jgi:hypothetical protein
MILNNDFHKAAKNQEDSGASSTLHFSLSLSCLYTILLISTFTPFSSNSNTLRYVIGIPVSNSTIYLLSVYVWPQLTPDTDTETDPVGVKRRMYKDSIVSI